MRLSPVSVLVGALLAAVVFLSMAQTTVGTPLRVEYIPHPRDMVQVQEGTPYVVPTGKLFVLTSLGVTTQGPTCYLHVNGQTEVVVYVGAPYAGGSNMVAVPSGFTVQPGATVDVITAGSSTGYARAWGYLVNQ